MQKMYKSLYGQLAYVLISGLQLVFIPNIMFATFGLEPTQEIWPRIMGVLVLALSFYYYAMVHHGTPQVVRATVYGRLFFCAGLVVFVLIGLGPKPLLLFAAIETGLALWTWQELKK
ncbi:MAG: hypothetical protein EAZ91_17380 [Cytophagales bacterium]|nr:MAG: hypothetical protein EAZ91_17380 [Cytophagales bacterium]